MYTYYDGVSYDVSSILSNYACDLHMEKNGATGLWELEVCWNWEKMGDNGVAKYYGGTIEYAMIKAVEDRVKKGFKAL
jgi:hypothetical protein